MAGARSGLATALAIALAITLGKTPTKEPEMFFQNKNKTPGSVQKARFP